MRDDLNVFNFFNSLKKIADKYLSAGLCVLPASRTTKSPRVGKWSSFKKRLPTQTEVDAWFANEHDAVCVVCGEVSGNLELLDFDDKAGLFDAWKAKISGELFEKLVVETTQSGGRHVFYRCESKVCGNIKLAQKRIDLSDEEIINHKGKEYVWHNDKKYQVSVDGDGVMYFIVTQIETRGEGGLFLCAPTEGYSLTQGSFDDIPVITEVERISLLTAAWELNSHVPAEQVHAEESPKKTAVENGGTRPGDEFNSRGDFRTVLEKHGWKLVSCSNGNEYWRRPGKEGKSWSATYSAEKGVFYVFSSNAHPFEQGKGYSPFSIYAMLEHDGDFSTAASDLHTIGFGTLPVAEKNCGADISKIIGTSPDAYAAEWNKQDEAFWKQPPHVASHLIRDKSPLNTPIIEGLLREGETMNLIAPPKTGKSWLATDLALAVASGDKWLGRYSTRKGRVLLLDNELHLNLLVDRLDQIAKARNMPQEALDDVHIKPIRGHLRDLYFIGNYLKRFGKGFYRMIILDAFYRFMPDRMDENDNRGIGGLYNFLDRLADQLGCAFVLIHHTSKGIQAGKAVTDVGAGAGAQSRAADTHTILRRHQEEGVVVFDAAVRSWKPIKPISLKWHFPVWNYDPGYDPEDLEGAKPDRSANSKMQTESQNRIRLDADSLVKTCFKEGEVLKRTDIVNRASELMNVGETKANDLLVQARERNLLYFWKPEGEKYLLYSVTKKPPCEE